MNNVIRFAPVTLADVLTVCPIDPATATEITAAHDEMDTIRLLDLLNQFGQADDSTTHKGLFHLLYAVSFASTSSNCAPDSQRLAQIAMGLLPVDSTAYLLAALHGMYVTLSTGHKTHDEFGRAALQALDYGAPDLQVWRPALYLMESYRHLADAAVHALRQNDRPTRISQRFAVDLAASAVAAYEDTPAQFTDRRRHACFLLADLLWTYGDRAKALPVIRGIVTDPDNTDAFKSSAVYKYLSALLAIGAGNGQLATTLLLDAMGARRGVLELHLRDYLDERTAVALAEAAALAGESYESIKSKVWPLVEEAAARREALFVCCAQRMLQRVQQG